MALTKLDPNVIGQDSTGTGKITSAGGSVSIDSSGNVRIANSSANSILFAANGNVGVGLSAPTTLIHSKAAAFTDSIVTIDSTSTNVSQRLNLAANGTVQTQLYDDADQTILRSVTSKPLLIGTSNNERFRVDASGNTGFGTFANTISSKVEVVGRIESRGLATDPNYAIYMQGLYDSSHAANVAVAINSSPSEVIGVYADGGGANPRLILNPGNGWRVGVGTTTPYTFDGKVVLTSNNGGNETVPLSIVNGNSSTSTAVSLGFAPNINIDLARITALRTDTDWGGATDLQFKLYNGSGNTERARLDRYGRLSVGSAPAFGNTSIQAYHDSHFTEYIGRYGACSGSMRSKLIQVNTTGNNNVDLFTINGWQSANSRLIAYIEIVWVSAVSNVGGVCRGIAGAAYDGTTTQNGFTTEAYWGSSTAPSINWTGLTCRLNTHNGYYRYNVSVRYISMDGATVTFYPNFYNN